MWMYPTTPTPTHTDTHPEAGDTFLRFFACCFFRRRVRDPARRCGENLAPPRDTAEGVLGDTRNREKATARFVHVPPAARAGGGEGPGLAVGGYSEAPEPGRSISQMPVPRMYLPRTGAGAFREDFAPRCPSRLGGGDSLPKSREHLTYLVRRTSKNRHEMPK